MSQLARHLLLWSQKHLRLLRAIHIPGLLNRAADELSRAVLPGEWRLHPQTAQLIERLLIASCLLPGRGNTRHGMHWHSAGCGAPASMRSPQWAFSHRHCARSGRTRSRSCSWRRTGPLGLGSQNWCSSWQPLLGRFLWGRIYWLRDGAPYGTRVQTSGNLKCLVPGRDAEVLGDLPQEVVDTITSTRALSTRHAYALKWNLFVEWCSSHREDPRKCPIRVVLSFLQQGLERRLSPFTLKVYVAAIAANHDPVEGKSVGKHDLVIRFLRGAGRLNPPRPPSIPSWDLSLVLRALQQGPFGPLQTVELKFFQTPLLLALASIKRVGDLHAFSVGDSCLEFGPAQVILRPRPGYVPKVPTTPFRDQVVSLQALPSEEADPALALLVPSEHWHATLTGRKASGPQTSSYLSRRPAEGNAISKQRMAHWIVDAITLAY